MKIFTIVRVVENSGGTFGVLLEGNVPFALTLERQWINNERNRSCIPPGSYVCERVNSPKFGNTFEVVSVPNRSNILFHKGNLDDDTAGCILVGEQFGHPTLGEEAIFASREGFAEFLERTKGIDKFILKLLPLLVKIF